MEEEQKKMPEKKKQEEAKKAEETPKAEKEKPNEEANKEDKQKANEETKGSKDNPPLPQEIVLQVYMHCEGCARKVRKCLKGFEGVEDVVTDCKSHKVLVKGEKADPLKVLERVQRKSHRQVVLMSPIPKTPAEEKPEDNEVVKEDKKEEPQVILAVLRVHMHCEACAQGIKKRIQKMKGVENVVVDLKSSQVTVKGVVEASKLVESIRKKMGKQAVIVRAEAEKREEEKKPKEGNEEKKGEEGGEKEAKKGGEEKDEGKEKKQEGSVGGEEAAAAAPADEGKTAEAEQQQQQPEDPKMELRKNELYYYPQHNYLYFYPPTTMFGGPTTTFGQRDLLFYTSYPQPLPPPAQMFSDENPNACSVM